MVVTRKKQHKTGGNATVLYSTDDTTTTSCKLRGRFGKGIITERPTGCVATCNSTSWTPHEGCSDLGLE